MVKDECSCRRPYQGSEEWEDVGRGGQLRVTSLEPRGKDGIWRGRDHEVAGLWDIENAGSEENSSLPASCSCVSARSARHFRDVVTTT
jgi:hypothetical protein